MSDRSLPDEVAALVAIADRPRLTEVLLAATPSELAHLISRLESDQRLRLFELLPLDAAAKLVEALPLALAGDLVQEMPPRRAAEIIDQLASDDQTDLLAHLEDGSAAAVLAHMAPAEVADVGRLKRFPPDVAGGLMETEFVAYPADMKVCDVVADLRKRAAEYARYTVQYVYVLSSAGTFEGVVRLRDLLFHRDDELLGNLSLRAPLSVPATASLSELRDFFERYRFFAAPVVDAEDRLIGVVSRSDLEEAAADLAAQTLLRFGGIILGEEFRSMPLLGRAGARLAWLAMTMLLSFVAASVVGLYQDTLSEVIALAVFLPVISGMSGNAGNQSIAVTMRELSLGLVRPHEIGWVLGKEISVGLISGLALGLAMMVVAVVWQGSYVLGLVVGAAQMLSVLLAACLGGIVPLLLKRLHLDPAVASAPLLTTITDAAGFFLTLALASVFLRT